MNLTKKFQDWLNEKDCYGNPLLAEWEKSAIIKRYMLLSLNDLIIFEGNPDRDAPNSIIIDITHLSKKNFQPQKKVLINLAHYLRPCPCDCHQYQYECYLEDCVCCTDECT